MKKIFVDTNIIVDLVADRRPYSKFAIEIFSKAEGKKVTRNIKDFRDSEIPVFTPDEVVKKI